MTPKQFEASLVASSPPIPQPIALIPSMAAAIPNLDICLQILHTDNGHPKIKDIYAHRSVLANKCAYFRVQLEQLSAGANTLTLDLSTVKNAVSSFQTLLIYFYTGDVQIDANNFQSLLQLSKMYDLPDLMKQLNSSATFNTEMENKRVALLQAPASTQSGGSSPFTSTNSPISAFNPSLTVPSLLPPLNPAAFCAAYLQFFQRQQAQQNQQALINNLIQASLAVQSATATQFNPALLTAATPASSIFPRFDAISNVQTTNRPVETRISESEQPEARSLASSCSSANQQTAPSPPFDNVGDVIVPSNDKEGWCRNKKYIQTVPSGFKCLVCSKIYGRYNSVSYHITVYHRSPPIRCDVAGCQFTTREARYIYFHKYYRHGVPLPESIDTASRKCPFFSCRHVSKSPAMLEKHIARHVSDCSKNGCYSCPNCDYQTTQHSEMFEHLRLHQMGADCGEKPLKRSAPGPSQSVFQCNQCSYRGRTLSNLENHRNTKHHHSNPLMLPVDENLKLASVLPTLDAASLNLSLAVKALSAESLLTMLASSAVKP